MRERPEDSRVLFGTKVVFGALAPWVACRLPGQERSRELSIKNGNQEKSDACP